jgi:hypothetical protein
MWSGSAMFSAYTRLCLLNDPAVAGTWGGGADATGARFYLALFGAATTPDAYAPDPETHYQGGVWGAGEIAQPPGWPPGGIEAGLDAHVPAGVAGGTALHHPLVSRAGVTVHGVAGDLLYDHVTFRGLGFHDYGGTVDVDNGLLVMTWDDPPGIVCLNMSAPSGPARTPPKMRKGKPRARRGRRRGD